MSSKFKLYDDVSLGDVEFAPITEAEAGEGVSWRVTEAGTIVSLDGSEPPAAAFDKSKQIEASVAQNLGTVLNEDEQERLRQRWDTEVAVMRDVRKQRADSLENRLRLERFSLLRELRDAFIQMFVFYTKPEGSGLSVEEAMQMAGVKIKGQEEAKKLYEELVFHLNDSGGPDLELSGFSLRFLHRIQ